jgi:hypothetical protein
MLHNMHSFILSQTLLSTFHLVGIDIVTSLALNITNLDTASHFGEDGETKNSQRNGHLLVAWDGSRNDGTA